MSKESTSLSILGEILGDIFFCKLKPYHACCCTNADTETGNCDYNNKSVQPDSSACIGNLSLTILCCVSPCQSCLSINSQK
jgi:hypothetical protein